MARSSRPKRPSAFDFKLFERSSGGLLNLRFDSDALESLYTACSFRRACSRFRFAIGFVSITSLTWLIYIALLRFPGWVKYLTGFVAVLVTSLLCLVLTFSDKFFQKGANLICTLQFTLVGLMAILVSFYTSASLTLVFNLSILLQFITIVYTMIPLRLWQSALLCLTPSIVQIVLVGVVYRSAGSSSSLTLIHVVAHVWVHSVGIILHLTSQVWRRSTFIRLVHNTYMEQKLEKEQRVRDDMIQSLMPQKVAQEVMDDGGGGGGDNDPDKKGEVDDLDDDEGSRSRVKPGGYGDEEVSDPNAVALQTPRRHSSNASPDASYPLVAFRKFHVSQLENVSVLFADIVGFTKMSSNKSASHLVTLLNDLFGRFDRLCSKIECEKIATLGDCYYCVAGCPDPTPDHAERAVEMGRAMCLAIQQFDQDHNEQVNMRVGVHTGKVICGLVGTRRFKFDVWSNDVTLANEMESSGKAGLVHISETTLEFVKDIYEVSEGEPVRDIRHLKVLVEFFNKEEQRFAIKHTQDEAMIKTYFVERRFDDRPVVTLTPLQSTKDLLTAQPGGAIESSQPATAVDESTPLAPSVTVALEENAADQGQSAIVGASKDATRHDSLLPDIDTTALHVLQGSREIEQAFSFPPISRIWLNFHDSREETSYRRLNLRPPPRRRGSNDDSARVLTWASPRIAPVVNACLNFFILLLAIGCCLAIFPHVKRYSVAFYAVAGFGLLFHALFLTILIADAAAWTSTSSSHSANDGWRSYLFRFYQSALAWERRNLLCFLILSLPPCVILASYSGSYFTSPSDPYFLFNAYYRVAFGLLLAFCVFNLTIFTSISSWTKSSLLLLLSIVTCILIWIPSSSFPSLLDAYQLVWAPSVVPTLFKAYNHSWPGSYVRNWLQAGSATIAPTGHFAIQYELTIVLILTTLLIVSLNRELDISHRLSFHRDYQARRSEAETKHRRRQTDLLLQNIIPDYIIDDLRRNHTYSMHIDDAGIIFACISNFAEFYDEQYQGGQEMLRVLNEIFADFENQLALPQYNEVEKIKTIGACFMAASGLNLAKRRRRLSDGERDEHLWALLDFAQDLLRTLDDFNKQMFNFKFEMKIGFNVGEVTAGVIGTTKLLYDIWGDSVNVASRMYSTGERGRIQVTEAVARRLEPRYKFTYRGEVQVKGKGNMQTYLLDEHPAT